MRQAQGLGARELEVLKNNMNLRDEYLADAHISKPISMELLVRIVRRLLKD